MRASFLGLFLVLFIDGMGQGLLFPILIRDLSDPNSMVLTSTHSEALRNAYYGIILGVFFLCWFVGAPILGRLSDSWGRKKTLMICLWGTLIGYFLSAMAFVAHSVALLIIGRIIDGITAGSQPIAQAAAVDISDEKAKSRNIGLVLFALTLGIVFGPLVGGFLSNPDFVSWFGGSTPMFFAMILSFLNILILKFSFKDTRPGHGKLVLKVTEVFDTFRQVFVHKKVLHLSICFLIIQTGWAFYYFYISLFVAKRFDFSPVEVSILFTFLGLGLCIGLAFLTKFFSGTPMKKVITVGYSLLALGVILTMVSQTGILVWIVIIPLAAALGTAYAFAMGLFSNQVDETKQGWVMGITGGITSIAGGVSSILSGFLSNISIFLPLIVSVVLLVIGILLFLSFKSAPPKPVEKQG